MGDLQQPSVFDLKDLASVGPDPRRRVSPLIVLAASFLSGHGAVRITSFDLACGGISVAALAAWLGLGRASLAVLFAVLADGAAAIPTIRKAWRRPHTEKERNPAGG